jgi:hypothetical protein
LGGENPKLNFEEPKYKILKVNDDDGFKAPLPVGAKSNLKLTL